LKENVELPKKALKIQDKDAIKVKIEDEDKK